MRFMLRGARLVDASTDLEVGDVLVEAGALGAVADSLPDAGSDITTVNLDGMIITPGFLDIHTHGGGGFNLHTSDPSEIAAYAQWAPSTGLTSFLIAVVGTPDALPTHQLEAAVVACERQDAGAEPVGIYLEGPYINVDRRGAHMASWLRRPDLDETNELLALSSGHLRLITIAPELPGASPISGGPTTYTARLFSPAASSLAPWK